MQKLFDEVGSLDKRCYEEFGLSEDILMEHAADGMADFIRQHFPKGAKVLIVCGSGNNGADGITLSRLLYSEYRVELFFVKDPGSTLAKLQYERVRKMGIKRSIYINECDVVVDAIYGTGFKEVLNYEVSAVLQAVNELDAYKIACDVPSGLKYDGTCDKNSFQADRTLTMGALKKSLFSDQAKDYVGEIAVIDLGLARDIYEVSTDWHLLEEQDLVLPFRAVKDTHKGDFGHLGILCGEKSGASSLSARAALRFGAGLVTLVANTTPNLPNSIMSAHSLPSNATALALGMGLGSALSSAEMQTFLDNTLPLLVDADIFHMDILSEILERNSLVITPHPKEFVALLKATNLADISIQELQNKRFKYTQLFCSAYPDVVLLLKGANVIIGKENAFFINPHGTSALAKGGSGDVLSGLIGALLAQGVEPLQASINASLAHTQLAKNYTGADFSLTPDDLIDGIGNL